MRNLLHFQSRGEGTHVVVLLHGLLGQGSNLGMIARELARERRVIAPDLRNHGHSFRAAAMDYRSMSTDILCLLDALNIARAALVGHSMGAKVAMQFAFDHASRVEAVVAGDIAPVAYPAHHDDVFAALHEADRPELDRRATRNILQRHIAEQDVIAWLLGNRARDHRGAWHWRFDLQAIAAGYSDILAAPRCEAPCEVPILFIKGERSDYLHESQAETIRGLFPHASLRIIADTDHWLHAQKPRLFGRLVREFIDASAAPLIC